MPVETTLDLSMFQKPDSVLKLLKYYDFNVTKPMKDHLQLKGSFLKLKLLRTELIHLQGHGHQLHSRSPSALHNGFSYDTEHNSLDPSKSISGNIDNMGADSRHQLLDSAPSLSSPYRDSASGGFPRSLQSSYYSSVGSTSHTVDTDIPNYVLMQQQSVMGNEMLAHRQSPLVDVPSSSTNSTSSPTMQHHKSYSDSASGGSLRRRPSFDGDTWASSSHSSPQRFPVDTDTINFILTQRQDVVKAIEQDYGTKMVVKDDGAGFTMVSFVGKNSEKAKAHFLDSINEISPSLCIQEMHLKKYDHTEQKHILKRIQRNEDLGVMITLSGDVVKLVGSPRESFEMMQRILGHSGDSHRGRVMERSSKSRRSSSVPRQCKLEDHARIRDQENQASAANKYSPSSYQEKSDEVKAPQIVQGKTPDKNSQQTRSNSESQDKNRTVTEQTMYQNMELVSSSQAKKSPRQQVTKFLKQLDPSYTKMDFKKLQCKTSNSKPQK